MAEEQGKTNVTQEVSKVETDDKESMKLKMIEWKEMAMTLTDKPKEIQDFVKSCLADHNAALLKQREMEQEALKHEADKTLKIEQLRMEAELKQREIDANAERLKLELQMKQRELEVREQESANKRKMVEQAFQIEQSTKQKQLEFEQEQRKQELMLQEMKMRHDLEMAKMNQEQEQRRFQSEQRIIELRNESQQAIGSESPNSIRSENNTVTNPKYKIDMAYTQGTDTERGR